MGYLKQQLRKQGKALWLGPLFKWLEAVLELLVPLLTANIIDVGVANGDASYVLSRGAIMVLLAALGGVFALVCQYYSAAVSAKYGAQIRKHVFSHAMKLSQGQVENMGRGKLSTCVTNDVNQIQAALNMFMRLAPRVPFLTVGAIVMSMFINFYAGLVYLFVSFLISIILVWIMRKTLDNYGDIQKGQDELFRLAQENLEGVRVIRAFSRQDTEQAQFEESAGTMSRILVQTGRISAMMTPAAGVLANLAIVAVVWFGAQAVNAGGMMTGDIIALVNYMMQILVALLMATNLLVLFTRALASAKRVEVLLQERPNIVSGVGAKQKDGEASFSFRHVSFRYFETADNAINDVDFSVWPGQSVGVIGGTGCGKSTLIHLLLRHFDANEGKIELCGEDVRHYNLQQLRSHFGVVMQGAGLVSGSIRHNLLLSNPKAGQDELWEALQAAQAAEFVRAREGGLDSVLGERGGGLSGGQKQRLLIARALVRKPDILVLDDASSALDYATESALRMALKAWKTKSEKDLTTFIVGQRVATVRACDMVFVMDDGRIVAKGTHDELRGKSTLYSEICNSQGVSN